MNYITPITVVNLINPAFTTSVTVPVVYGGTATTSTLTLRPTSGVGITGADVIITTGAGEVARALNDGTWTFTAPTVRMPSGAVTNYGNDNVLVTHSAGQITLTGNLVFASGKSISGQGISPWVSETGFGYDVNSYRAVRIGTSAVFLGVDASTNSGGNFAGNEIVIGNARSIIAPTAANTDYRHLVSIDSSNNTRFGNMGSASNHALIISDTGLAAFNKTSSFSAQFEVVSSTAATVTQILRGAASQSGDYLNINSNAGSGGNVLAVTAAGIVKLSGDIYMGGFTYSRFGIATADAPYFGYNFKWSSGTVYQHDSTGAMAGVATIDTGELRFYTDSSGQPAGTTAVERARLNATGFGIGVTPTYKLDIATAAANDRGVNVAVTSATGTNYGSFVTMTGASTANTGFRASISGAADMNTGIYVDVSGATGVNAGINIANPTAGAANWTIYASATAQSYFAGKVGFGIAAPVSQAHVKSSTAATVGLIVELASTPTANAFEVNSNGGIGGDLAKIDATGRGFLADRLGIGVTPSYSFHLKTSSGIAYLERSGGGSSTSGAYVIAMVTDIPTAAEQRLGRLAFGSNSTSNDAASISGYSGAAWGAGNASAYLTLHTTPVGSLTPVERVRIEPTGRATFSNQICTGPAAALTIATGAITITKSFHKVDTEAAAASDDLDTISGGLEGDELTIIAANAARDIVVKNGTGNIKLTKTAGDITLDDTDKCVTLKFNGTNWMEQ